MVALRDLKVLASRVRFRLTILGSEENRGNAKHAYDGEDLACAAKLLRNNQHLRKGRVQRKFDHLTPELCQIACVIKCAKYPQLIHTIKHVLLRWRIHEVKFKQVVHLQALEKKDHI